MDRGCLPAILYLEEMSSVHEVFDEAYIICVCIETPQVFCFESEVLHHSHQGCCMMLELGGCLREVGCQVDSGTEVQKWCVRVGSGAQNLVYSFYVNRRQQDVYRQ